jgi:hypothetical protein
VTRGKSFDEPHKGKLTKEISGEAVQRRCADEWGFRLDLLQCVDENRERKRSIVEIAASVVQ